MANPSSTIDQNLLPVQAYFDVYGNFQTFIGQGKPFFALINPYQSGLHITNSTIDSTTIGATTPSTGAFTSLSTNTGTIVTNAANPTDIVNLLTLQAYAAGLSWKNPVTAATMTNITLSGTQTVDGVVLIVGNTVLVKNQTNSAENGIYKVKSGAWQYATGATTWDQYVSALVFVEYGSQTGSAWYCTAQPGGTLGVTAMNWSNFSVSSSYTAGTGLTLAGFQFSITNTTVTAAAYGSASSVPTFTVNAQGQLTAASNTAIAINGNQITSGTISSAYLSGSYTGITGVGTLTAGTWNASTIGVPYGGTGSTTLTGYVKGNGTSAMTASTTVPTTDLSGTITNAQLANSTISGVSLGGSLANLTAGTNITFNSGTTYNGSAAITINATVPAQVYPAAGIANSTGSAWGTSYSTTGSGTVVALATSPVFVTPTLGAATATSLTSSTVVANGSITGSSQVGAFSYGTMPVGSSDVNIFASFTSSVNNYNQMIMQNTNSGAAASTDYVVNNNNSTSSTFYGDYGMNSSGWTGVLGTASMNAPNVVYLQSASTDLIIGTVTSNAIRFVANNGADNAVISSAGVWSFSNTITGSISGNAGSATTATTATNATNTAVTDNTSSSATWYPTIVSNNTGNLPQTVSSTKLSFVPSTGVLSATSFSGSGANLTGVITSLTAGTGITVSGSTINAVGTTINSQTTAYTLIATDAGKTISITTGGVTVNNSVMSAGNIVSIYNNSGTSQTITQGSGVTLQFTGQTTSITGNRTLGLYGLATIIFISASSAVITGTGLS